LQGGLAAEKSRRQVEGFEAHVSRLEKEHNDMNKHVSELEARAARAELLQAQLGEVRGRVVGWLAGWLAGWLVLWLCRIVPAQAAGELGGVCCGHGVRVVLLLGSQGSQLLRGPTKQMVHALIRESRMTHKARARQIWP